MTFTERVTHYTNIDIEISISSVVSGTGVEASTSHHHVKKDREYRFHPRATKALVYPLYYSMYCKNFPTLL